MNNSLKAVVCVANILLHWCLVLLIYYIAFWWTKVLIFFNLKLIIYYLRKSLLWGHADIHPNYLLNTLEFELSHFGLNLHGIDFSVLFELWCLLFFYVWLLLTLIVVRKIICGHSMKLKIQMTSSRVPLICFCQEHRALWLWYKQKILMTWEFLGLPNEEQLRGKFKWGPPEFKCHRDEAFSFLFSF